MPTGERPAGICGLGATGGFMRELFVSWLPVGRPPSVDASEGVRDEGVMMLTEVGGGEVVLLLMGGGEVMVGGL